MVPILSTNMILSYLKQLNMIEFFFFVGGGCVKDSVILKIIQYDRIVSYSIRIYSIQFPFKFIFLSQRIFFHFEIRFYEELFF